MSDDKRAQVSRRVGVFVFLALVVGVAIAFVIGSQRGLFSPKTEFRVVFQNVDGLRVGNTVNVAGVSVGSVDSVEFLPDGRVEVAFQIVDSAAALVRGNPERPAGEQNPATGEDVEEWKPSMVTIGSKGLLGDKLIEISVGHPELPEWDEEKPLFVDSSAGLMERANAIAANAEEVTESVREAIEPWRDQVLAESLEETSVNLARLTGLLVSGDGVVNHLLADPESAESFEASLAELRATTAELRRTSVGVRNIVDEVATGDGSAHALIYGDDGRLLAQNLAAASGELATLLRATREEQGLVHSLLYDPESRELLHNLNRTAENLAAVSDDMRAGRGTLGGLLVDPSIYEDVKRLVGDLQQNEILRALVRYSIRHDEDPQGRPEVSE